jgi:hypothetical protein
MALDDMLERTAVAQDAYREAMYEAAEANQEAGIRDAGEQVRRRRRLNAEQAQQIRDNHLEWLKSEHQRRQADAVVTRLLTGADRARKDYIESVRAADDIAKADAKANAKEYVAKADKEREEVSKGWGVWDNANPKDAIGILKPRLDLVPPAAIIQTALAMSNGADKYGPFNWREKHVKGTVYVAAALRHLLQWLDGEDVAEDSGVLHLAHASACLAILIDATEGGNLIDDRPSDGPAARVIARETRS